MSEWTSVACMSSNLDDQWKDTYPIKLTLCMFVFVQVYTNMTTTFSLNTLSTVEGTASIQTSTFSSPQVGFASRDPVHPTSPSSPVNWSSRLHIKSVQSLSSSNYTSACRWLLLVQNTNSWWVRDKGDCANVRVGVQTSSFACHLRR